MSESHVIAVDFDKNQLQKVVLLSEKSEKILSEYSEQLKKSSLTAVMGLVSKGVPDEIISALDDYKNCCNYFKGYALASQCFKNGGESNGK